MTLNYTCDPGFIMIGESLLTCLSNATYDYEFPECLKICTGNTTVEGGSFTANTTSLIYESVVLDYACNAGLTLVGNETVTCQPDGTFDSALPSCIVQCNASFTVMNATWNATYPFAIPGEAVNFTCDPGFKLIGNGMLICQQNTEFDSEPPMCLKTCNSTFNFDNGTWTTNGTNNDSYAGVVIDFQCSQGLNLVGNKSLTCHSNGTYDDIVPTCEPVTCDSNVTIMNGYVTIPTQPRGGVSIGSFLNFTCDSGFTMSGASAVECLPNGSYNASSPICAVTCDSNVTIMNGYVSIPSQPSGGVSIGSCVNFTCDDDFALNGAYSVECLANGSYNASSPICVPGCNETIVLSNGQIFMPDPLTETVSVGMYVNFTCNIGYQLLGSTSVQCRANGTFNDSFPQCVDSAACNIPSIADGGFILSPGVSAIDVDVTLYFYCNNGSVLSGPGTAKCLASGDYDSVIPVCINGTQIPLDMFSMPATSDTSSENAVVPLDPFTFNSDPAAEAKAPKTLTLSKSVPLRPEDIPMQYCLVPELYNGSVLIPALEGQPMRNDTYYFIRQLKNVYFECIKDNEMQGKAILTCTADGSFSDDFPSCQLRQPKAKPYSPVLTSVMTGIKAMGCLWLIGTLSACLILFAILRIFSRERFLQMGQEVSILVAYLLILTVVDAPADPNETSARCEAVAIAIQAAFISAAAFLALEALNSFCLNTNVVSAKSLLPVLVAGGAVTAVAGLSTSATAAASYGKYRTDFAISSNSIFIKTLLFLGAFASGSFASFSLHAAMTTAALVFNIALGLYMFASHALSDAQIRDYTKKLASKMAKCLKISKR